MRKTAITTVLCLLLITVFASDGATQGPPKKLSKERVVAYLKGDVAPARIAELAREHGIDFGMTPEIENELRSAGATDALLTVLRELAPKRTAPKEEPAPPALLIESSPGGAQVFVDDELVARTSPEGRLRIRLAPGQHRVRLSLEGYRDNEQNIQLLAGGEAPEELAVRLTKVSGPETTNLGLPTDAGKALAARAVAAMGGLAKLQSVTSMHATFAGSGKKTTWTGDLYVLQDRVRIDFNGPKDRETVVISPDLAFVSTSKGTRALSVAEKNEHLARVRCDLLYIGQHLEDPSFAFTVGGTERIGDVQTAVLNIGGAVSGRWYVDPQSGRVLREDCKRVGKSGSFESEDDSDWRTVDGLTLPFTFKGKNAQITYTQFQVNPEIDTKIFEMPMDKAKKVKKFAKRDP
jgi:hypothetical protein